MIPFSMIFVALRRNQLVAIRQFSVKEWLKTNLNSLLDKNIGLKDQKKPWSGIYQFNGIPEASTGLISDGQEVGQLYANDFDCTETEPTACGLIFSIGIGSKILSNNSRAPANLISAEALSSLALNPNSLAPPTKYVFQLNIEL